MQIICNSVAGTLESSDIHIEVSPGQGIGIDLSSAVMRQFGESIKKTMLDVLQDMKVSDVRISAHDRGALDCVIRARMKTALLRAGGEKTP
jgi:citrate lyase subunit gamma (acyl carrier protein)